MPTHAHTPPLPSYIYLQRLPPPIGRFVPFVAVIAANMVNIPLVRQEELKNGIQITDKDGNKLGDACSKVSHTCSLCYHQS